MSQELVEQILAKLRSMNSDEFANEDISQGNTLQDILKELEYFEKWKGEYDIRLNTVIEHLAELSDGNFLNKLPISEKEDQLDVIAMALNTVSEELSENAISKGAFDNLFNSLESPFIVVDSEELVLLKYNSIVFDFFHYKGENKYKIPIQEIFDDHLVRKIERFKKSSLEKFAESFQFNQKELIIHFSKLSSFYDSSSVSIAMLVVDVTSRFAEEQLKSEKAVLAQSLKFKSSFLANMSHEIRTPLNGIIGMTDILLDDPSTKGSQREFLDIIKNSSDTLLHIINDILDLSKIEAGKMTLNPVVVDLDNLVIDINRLFFPIAQRKGISFRVSLREKSIESLLIDQVRLLQVLNNLINNAIKFTDKGDVEVIVSSKETYDGVILEAEVKDSGIGIEPKDLEFLFTEFTQASSGVKKSHSGTGLGLSICQKLVQLMDGNIKVESELGVGSSFSFWVKGRKTTKRSSDVRANSSRRNKVNTRTCKVLVVDDKSVNLTVARLMLEKLNCKVETVLSGLDAIDMVERETFDLIFLDIQMPVMDGVTTLNKLKDIKNDLCPVIALTANAIEGDRERYLRDGFNDYVPKPVKKDVLEEVIEKWFIVV